MRRLEVSKPWPRLVAVLTDAERVARADAWSNSVSSRSNRTARGVSGIMPGGGEPTAACVINSADASGRDCRSNLMPSLRERLAEEGELLTFADTEPIQALQAILEHVRAHRARAAVCGDAARRRADQPHQDRPAAGARRGPRDVAHRRLHARRSSKPSSVAAAARGAAPSAAPSRRSTDGAPSPSKRRRAARLARHAARAALPRPPGRRDPARWQSRERRRSVGRRRAGASRPTILRPNQKVRVSDADRRFRACASAARSPGRSSSCRSRRRRRATAPASSSPTPTPQRMDDFCTHSKQ